MTKHATKKTTIEIDNPEKSKKQRVKPVVEDKRKTAREEHTNHFTNRASLKKDKR